MIDIPTTAGYLAGFMTGIQFIPQVYKAWKTQSTRDLSGLSISITLFSNIIWLIYSVPRNDYPVTIASLIVLVSMITLAKIKYTHHVEINSPKVPV